PAASMHRCSRSSREAAYLGVKHNREAGAPLATAREFAGKGHDIDPGFLHLRAHVAFASWFTHASRAEQVTCRELAPRRTVSANTCPPEIRRPPHLASARARWRSRRRTLDREPTLRFAPTCSASRREVAGSAAAPSSSGTRATTARAQRVALGSDGRCSAARVRARSRTPAPGPAAQ